MGCDQVDKGDRRCESDVGSSTLILVELVFGLCNGVRYVLVCLVGIVVGALGSRDGRVDCGGIMAKRLESLGVALDGLEMCRRRPRSALWA